MSPKFYSFFLAFTNVRKRLNFFILIFFLTAICTEVKAQSLKDEKVIFAEEQIELIEYLGADFFAMVTYNTSICESNTLCFIRNGQILSRYNLPENFVKEMKVRNDSIVVSTVTMYSDVSGLVGGGNFIFDMDGNYLSNEFGGFDNNDWHHYEEIIVVDNGENALIADSSGQIFHFDISGEKLYPLVHPLPANPSKPLFMINADHINIAGDVASMYIFAYDNLLMTGTQGALYGNDSYNSKNLNEIRFVKHLGQDRILVIHEQQILILDYLLNEINSSPLTTIAEKWSYEGHFLFGVNDLGTSQQDSSSTMLEVFRIQLSDLTEISRDTILHTLSDINVKGFRDTLFVVGISPDGKQGVLQAYNLSVPAMSTPDRTNIEVEMEVIAYLLNTDSWMYSLLVYAEIEVTNKMHEIVNDVLLTYYERWPRFCGALKRFDEPAFLQQNESRVYSLQIEVHEYSTTDGGDSLLFSIPCVSAFPLLMPYDIDVSDNTVCQSIKVKKPTTSTQETSAEETKWKVYPNPAEDMLYLNFEALQSNSIRFSLWNAQGQNIHTWQSSAASDEISLNSMNIPGGIYWISAMDIKDGRSFGTKTFIKR